MDDITLVNECVKGNARAQRMLFDKFAGKMMSVCLRYAKNTEQAEDVLQDGFVKVFMKLSDFKKEGSLEGWIRRIMVNTALDQIRKEARFKGNLDIEDVGYKIENNAFILRNELIVQAKSTNNLVVGGNTIYAEKKLNDQLSIDTGDCKDPKLGQNKYIIQPKKL